MRKQRRRISCFARTLLPVFPSQGCCEEPSIPALSSPCVFSAPSAPPPPALSSSPRNWSPAQGSVAKSATWSSLLQKDFQHLPFNQSQSLQNKQTNKKTKTWGSSSWNKNCKHFTFQKKNYQPLRELPPKWRPKILFFCFSCSLGQNPLPLALL